MTPFAVYHESTRPQRAAPNVQQTQAEDKNRQVKVGNTSTAVLNITSSRCSVRSSRSS